VSTVAGVAKGHADGEGSAAKFYQPYGVCACADRSVWVADFGNHCIRRIMADGTVSTVAGVAGSSGHADDKELTIDDFTLVNLLGQGAVGNVWYAVKQDTQQTFAVKIFDRHHIIGSSSVGRVLAEREIMTMLEHPFVITLHFAFQDDARIFFVVDYLSGGDFFRLMKQIPDRRMSEEATMFYAAEIMLALEYLHQNNIFVRDLKPENILLSAEGHIRVYFGLASCNTDITVDTTHTTVCGTPEYMAPEVIREEGHGRPVDYWALGIIIYEMIVGKTPWSEMDMTDMFISVLTKPVPFPKYVSNSAKHLIEGLMSKDPNTRMGVNGADEVKNHPFFKTVNWGKIGAEQCKPPFIPEVKNPQADQAKKKAEEEAKEKAEEEAKANAAVVPKVYTEGVSMVAGVARGHADGEGSAAKFNQPYGVCACADGSVWVADYGNHCIRRIAADGTVSTVAGVAASRGHAYVDKDGDHIKFTVEGSNLIKYVNGIVNSDSTGIVTELTIKCGSPYDVRDQNSWGSTDYPEHVVAWLWSVAQEAQVKMHDYCGSKALAPAQRREYAVGTTVSMMDIECTLEKQLGAGASATVFEVSFGVDGQMFPASALKVFRTRSGFTQLCSEASIMLDLSWPKPHPNVLQVEFVSPFTPPPHPTPQHFTHPPPLPLPPPPLPHHTPTTCCR
jgi:hypothetical protein